MILSKKMGETKLVYCSHLVCAKKFQDSIFVNQKGTTIYLKGNRIQAEPALILSCGLTAGGSTLRANQFELTIENRTHISSEKDNTSLSLTCLKSIDQCERKYLKAVNRNSLIDDHIYLYLDGQNKVRAQCINQETLLGFNENGEKVFTNCNMTSQVLKFPAVVLSTGSILSQETFPASHYMFPQQKKNLLKHFSQLQETEEGFLIKSTQELATVLGQTWEDLKSDRLMPVHIASWTSALLALTVATCSVCLMLCCCKAADKKLININFRTPRFVRTTRATILARRNREHLLSTLSIPPGEGAAVRPPSDRQQPEEVSAGERRKPTAPATPTG